MSQFSILCVNTYNMTLVHVRHISGDRLEISVYILLRTSHLYFRSKKPVENLPKFHYVHHRLEKKKVEEGNYYEQHETAIAKP